MAVNNVDISTNERLQLNEESINSGTIDRKFGRPEDYIELHIYNQDNQLLTSDYNFTQYKFPEGNTENLVSELNMDPVKVLRTKGYTTGKYKLVFNIQRSKIFNTSTLPFSIKEISSTRRELKSVTPKIINTQLDTEASRFIREIEAAPYLIDFVLNFNNDVNITGINLALNKNSNKHEVLIKLIDPLPSNIKVTDSFKIVEEITDPIILNVDLGLESTEDEGIPLQGPNFKIDVRLNNSVPSSFKNYDEILDYSLTSSYHNLLNYLENREIPDVSYDFIRTVSGSNEGDPLEEAYHFENFTHFSSAVERLKNFEYKIQLIELYDSQISNINSIPGASTITPYVLENKEEINKKKQNLIKGFDGYERFLYYTSGTFAWPKQNSTPPYNLFPISSNGINRDNYFEQLTLTDGSHLTFKSLNDGSDISIYSALNTPDKMFDGNPLTLSAMNSNGEAFALIYVFDEPQPIGNIFIEFNEVSAEVLTETSLASMPIYLNQAFKIYVNEGITTYNSNEGDQIVADVTNNSNIRFSVIGNENADIQTAHNISNTYPGIQNKYGLDNIKKFKSFKIELTEFGNFGSLANADPISIISQLKVFNISTESLPSLETAKTWLGSEIDTSPYYGGQLLSASLFDRQNENALTRLVPNHILDNPDNSFYSSFVNMVGQHFDQIWVHIKHLTEVNDAHHTRGISKELVYFSLKSLGLETFDQFENSNLIEYILGEGTSGSAYYDTPSNQSLITASVGSVPKSDITKNIWKRLYHNAPYLLKTKGTERGLRALMSCYGVPSTILNVKEYGGSTSDRTTYKTFTNDKGSLALEGDSGTNGQFIKTPWNTSLTHPLSASAKTVEFRIKPHRSDENYHLFSLSGSTEGTLHHLILESYGGKDISSSLDSDQYGRLKYIMENVDGFELTPTVSEYFPVYNGDFWNIFVGTEIEDPDNDNGFNYTPVKFGAYQANHLKNINFVTSSTQNSGLIDSGIEVSSTTYVADAWGLEYTSSTNEKRLGADLCFIGGLPRGGSDDTVTDLRYSGSLQEVRYYFGELLSHETLKKHALEPFMYGGNNPSSSYENLVLRLPLGSNDKSDYHYKLDSETHFNTIIPLPGREIFHIGSHPNFNVNYLDSMLGDDLIDNNVWKTNGNLNSENTIGPGGTNSSFGANISGITAPPAGFRFQTDASSPDINLKNRFAYANVGINIGIIPKDRLLTYTISDSNHPNGLAVYDQRWQNTDAIEYILNTTVGTHELVFEGGTGVDFILKRKANSIDITIKDIVVKELTSIESIMNAQTFEEVVEEHYTPTPDTVGISTTSEKTRIDIGTIDDDWLSPTRKTETSTLDNQPPDYEDLGVFFSPTNELNEDIIYTLGAFRLDDYIGSPLPSVQIASEYKDLEDIKDIYFQKVERRYNYWDYIKLIQYIDHTLFKLIEQWVPMKANLKTGLLIEPHYLERTKFARELPVIDDDQTMIAGSYNTINFEIEPNNRFNLDGSSVIVTNNLSDTTGSKGQRLEQGTNTTINLNDYIVEISREAAQAPIKPYTDTQPAGYVARKSSTLLGNATKGRLSSRYYRKRIVGSSKDTEY